MSQDFDLSKAKAAKLLGVGTTTVERMVKEGLLSYRQYVTGGRVSFSGKEIRDLMEKSIVPKANS